MNKIDRFFTDDDTSYFLFGPRGTGKTTWLNAVCGDGYRIDLLNAETMARRILLYRGQEQYLEQGVLVMPVEKFLLSLRPGGKILGV